MSNRKPRIVVKAKKRISKEGKARTQEVVMSILDMILAIGEAKDRPSKEEKEFNKQCDKAGGWIDYLLNKNKGDKG